MRACHYTIPVSLSMGQTKTHGHAVNTEVGIDIYLNISLVQCMIGPTYTTVVAECYRGVHAQ